MKTKLGLEISDKFDCRTLKVKDISVYENTEDVFNMILEIKGPGQNCFKIFDVTPNFDITLNCSSLNFCCETCTEDYTSLPDGNYEIKFSIAPNLETIVEYNHFRNCKQKKKYLSANCHIWRERYTLKELKDKINTLFHIKEMMNSAVYLSEECLDIEGALMIYEEVESKLSNYGTCSSC